jgi:hypothetical protein
MTDTATTPVSARQPVRGGTPTVLRSERAWSIGVIGIALLPLAASAIRLATGAGDGYHPYADEAVIESLVRDVGRHWVLLGPYSRFGWFHPGPALYYMLAVPYRLTGSSSASLAFSALFINAGAVVGILLIARRRGGLPLLLLTALVVMLLVRTLGAQLLRQAWNPYVTVLPLLLLVFVAWSLACGERWAAPVAAGVGSFLVETHVGYALVVAVVVGAGAVGAVMTERRRRDDDTTRTWWPTLAVTGGVLVLLWLPVVVQQLTADRGNLDTVITFFADHGREQRYEDAWHVLSLQLGVWPDWLGGDSARTVIATIDFSRGLPVPVGLFALIGAAVVTWRRARDAFLLDCIVLATLAASFVATTRIVGDVLTYLVKWTWVLGAVTWIAIAWSCVAVWRARKNQAERSHTIARVGMLVLLIVFVGTTTVDVVAGARAGTPAPVSSAAMGRFGDAAFAALPDRDGVVEMRARGREGAYWATAGVVDVLEHHGLDVRVGPELEFIYSSHRLVGDEPVRASIVVADGDARAKVRALPGYRAVARDPNVTVFVGRA